MQASWEEGGDSRNVRSGEARACPATGPGQQQGDRWGSFQDIQGVESTGNLQCVSVFQQGVVSSGHCTEQQGLFFLRPTSVPAYVTSCCDCEIRNKKCSCGTGGTFDTLLLLLFLPQTVIAESRRRLSLGSVGECRGKLQLAFLSQLLVFGRR